VFTRRQFNPPAVVDADGVLGAVAKWILGLNERGALEISQARIYADQGIIFPATQVASTDANTLDDYEEGTWTPTITFAVPGDLAVGYTTRYGDYEKIGRQVVVRWNIVTSSFTHTTASGNFSITGLPFAATNTSGFLVPGSLTWQGITKVGYTQINAYVSASGSAMALLASASGANNSDVAAADMPTAGSVSLRGCLTYRI
jgi:hypothetical protein